MIARLLLAVLVCLGGAAPFSNAVAQADASSGSRPAVDRNLALFRWCSALMGADWRATAAATEQPPYPLDRVGRGAIAGRFDVPLETSIASDTPEPQLAYAGWWHVPKTGSTSEFSVLVIERVGGDEMEIATIYVGRGGEGVRRDRLRWDGATYAWHEVDGTRWRSLQVRVEQGVGALMSIGSIRYQETNGWNGESWPLCFVRAER